MENKESFQRSVEYFLSSPQSRKFAETFGMGPYGTDDEIRAIAQVIMSAQPGEDIPLSRLTHEAGGQPTALLAAVVVANLAMASKLGEYVFFYHDGTEVSGEDVFNTLNGEDNPAVRQATVAFRVFDVRPDFGNGPDIN